MTAPTKELAILALGLLLAGCDADRAMPKQEAFRGAKRCVDAGMVPIMHNTYVSCLYVEPEKKP